MSIFKAVELSIASNNKEHHTDEITEKELIVRRGQPFTVILKLTKSFQPALHPLTLVTLTGKHPSQEHGTLSYFGIPDNMHHSPSAKAVWKTELKKESSQKQGILHLAITPPADVPIGEYTLTAKHRDEETLLALTTVLFNPWCPDDSVFLPDDEERKEYVMNEKGIIFRGSIQSHSPLIWDYGQFEEDMVKICMKLLDVSHKHGEDAVVDCSRHCDPVYVGRVVSAMINSVEENDQGVLEGRWSYPYVGGFKPTHWTGSHDILKRWYRNDCHPVKYGQCWVFAGVMCSVMRLLGIPCRVVTNFESAHDTNKNLIIDVYHADYGVREKESPDSIWNFHVWVEGWMKRSDLAENGKYDGWQVLDPTPQEMSNGQYCCGPAPVKAILNGEVNIQYDVPFVFAEVNADCIDWLVKEDGSKIKIFSDTKRVGADMLTKSARSTRESLKQSYKYKEGSEEERAVFIHASTLNEAGTLRDINKVTTEVITPSSSVTMRFEEVAETRNGKDVKLKLVLHSESNIDRELSITISVQVMRHNGTPAVNIMNNEMKETLQPGKELSIPILIPFLTYHQPMLEGDSLKVSALVKDQKLPNEIYMAENNIVLLEPTLSITTDTREMKLQKIAYFQIIFKNPANGKLTECTLTLSGSGLLRDNTMIKLPDLPPNKQFRISISCIPYKTGERTLLADIDCKTFTDIKGNCTVTVIP